MPRKAYTLIEVIVTIALVIIVVASIGSLGGCGQGWGGKQRVRGTIKRVYEDIDGHSSRHMVVLEYGSGHTETFRNEDSIYYWKWNSTTIQNDLVVGKPYFLDVYGRRSEFFSHFRNIIAVEPNTEEPLR